MARHASSPPSLIQQLYQSPYRFDFYQAVRIIEYAANCAQNGAGGVSAPLSLKAPPSREFLQFNTQQTLAFSASDITAVEKIENDENNNPAHSPSTQPAQWRMTVTFMGLTGTQGVMPFYLSEAMISQLKLKNTGLRDFLEIFNHRAVTLYYKAWSKYQFGPSYEAHKIRHHTEKDAITDSLLSLIGHGLPSLQYRQPFDDESLIPLSGILSRDTCSATGLASMIRELFDLDVEIKQFTGAYSELTDDIVSKLGMQNNRLGENTFLGSKCHHCAGKFTVAITPRNNDEHDALAPGSPLVRALMAFVRNAAGPEMEFDLEVMHTDYKIPCTQLRDTDTYQPTLGWNTLLGQATDADDSHLLSVRMSSEILPPDDTLPLAS